MGPGTALPFQSPIRPTAESHEPVAGLPEPVIELQSAPRNGATVRWSAASEMTLRGQLKWILQTSQLNPQILSIMFSYQGRAASPCGGIYITKHGRN